MAFEKARDGGGQDARARQRHGADRDAAHFAAFQRLDFGKPGFEFDTGQAECAGEGLSALGQHDRIAAAFDQRFAQRQRQVFHRAVQRGNGKAGGQACAKVAATVGQRQQRAQTRSGDMRTDRMAQCGANARDQHIGGRGWQHAIMAAFKQRQAQLAFHPGECLRQRRLRQIDRARRCAHRAELRDLRDRGQMAQVIVPDFQRCVLSAGSLLSKI